MRHHSRFSEEVKLSEFFLSQKGTNLGDGSMKYNKFTMLLAFECKTHLNFGAVKIGKKSASCIRENTIICFLSPKGMFAGTGKIKESIIAFCPSDISCWKIN